MKNELFKLVRKYSGEKNLNLDDDLEWDIGVTGDDAFELLLEYRDKFDVDISTFEFNDYFFDEGRNISLLFRRLTRSYNKKRLTIRDLFTAIDVGKLE